MAFNASTNENLNFARLCCLLVDVGGTVLRHTFDSKQPPANLQVGLSSPSVHPTLESLMSNHVLSPLQWEKLFPVFASNVSSANFDVSLLMILLRNICCLSPPTSTGNWDKLPPDSDDSTEANIVRIKCYRDEVYVYASEASLDDPTFNELWQKISSAILELGRGTNYTVYATAIEQLKTECINPAVMARYQKLLNDWMNEDLEMANASTQENRNFACLCRLLVDVGFVVLRDVFDGIHPPANLHVVLSSPSVHPTLQSLRKKRVLNPLQWKMLLPTVASNVSSANFDVSLLIILLRHICDLNAPVDTRSWDRLPPDSDDSTEANIVRITCYRNEVYAHSSEASVDDLTFSDLWQKISSAIVELAPGTNKTMYLTAIQQLKTERMDPAVKAHKQMLLNNWMNEDSRTAFALTHENNNYACLSRLLVDVGCTVLRDIFDSKHPPANLHTDLSSRPVFSTLLNLHNRNLLKHVQWERLFPPVTSNVSSAKFDVSLLMILLRNICGLSPPTSTGNWDELPPDSDDSTEANIVRIKFYRNEVHAHASQASVDDLTFSDLWQKISSAILALACGTKCTFYRTSINRLKTEVMDPADTAYYMKLLDDWKKGEMKDAFDPAPYIEFICQRCEDCEGWLAPFPWCKEFRFRLDNIFTRLKFVSRKKQRGIKTDHIVDMFQIFQPHEECSQPRRVLIEGQPGKGKTTYCQKIAYDWAKKQKGRDSFADVQIVLLLKCRDIISGLWDAIDDQLLPREIDEEERERFFIFIRKHQSKVLVVLDGLDELPTSQLPKYEDVIQGRVLPKCYLVVTARHEAGIKVREYCHTLLEVEGFTKTDAEIFIKRYFKEKESLAKELLDKLNSDETLQDLAASPLNAALLCLLCEDFHGKLPQSRTVLYFEIIECVLRRYRERIKLPEKDEDLVALYQVELKDLGYIALEGLKNDRMNFEQSAFQGSSSNAIIGFGFLSVEPGQSKRRPSRCYAFLHKSLQEFLAAFYLCCQLVDEKIFPDSLVADHRYFEEFQQVLMFTVGLLAQKSKAKAKALIASIGHQVKDIEFRYVKVALCCINECREEQSTFDKELAKDLGLLLRVKKLAFSRIGKGAFAALVEVMKTNLTLQDLHFDWSEIGDEGLILLAEVLPENSKLRKLRLNQCKVTDVGASALAQTLKKIPLSELCLSENSISDEGVAALAQALEENSTLRTLDLSCGLIGDQGITKIAEVLVKNSTLTNLNVSYNRIGNRGGDVLAKALAENSTLSKIDLTGNLIDDKYATTLAEGLKNNSTLTCLNLSRNDIHYAGAAALVQAVEKNTTLTMLDLSENKLGNEHVSMLEDALKEIQHKVKASKLELVLYPRDL